MKPFKGGIVAAALLMGLTLTVATVWVEREVRIESDGSGVADGLEQRDVRVPAWGWPLYWALDDPRRGFSGRIDALDEWLGVRFLVDVACWTTLLLVARGFARSMTRKCRGRR